MKGQTLIVSDEGQLTCMPKNNEFFKFDKLGSDTMKKITIKPWYTEETLQELRSSKECQLDGRNVSFDLSYLSTREEREKLFRQTVLGESDQKEDN